MREPDPCETTVGEGGRISGADLVLAGLLLLGVGWFGWGSLKPGLSPEDAPGAAAYLDYYAQMIEKGPYSLWCPQWLCGHSLVLIQTGGMDYLLRYPFVRAFGPFAGMRVAWLTFAAIGAVVMYFYARERLGSRPGALLAGWILGIHPICISFGVRPGHLGIPFFYTFALLCLLALHRLAQRQSFGRLVTAALTVALCVFVDTERTAVFLPFALLLHAYESAWEYANRSAPIGRRLLRRFLAPVAMMGCITGGLMAFVLLPAGIESPAHYLFKSDTLAEARSQLSFNNPFFLLDRGGQLTSAWGRILEERFVANAGVLYLGLVPLVFLYAAAALPDRCGTRRYGDVMVLLLLLALWISFGPHSIYERTGTVVDRLLGDDAYAKSAGYAWFLAGLAFLLLAIPAYAVARAAGNRGQRLSEQAVTGLWVFGIAGVMALMLVKPFDLIVSHLPAYEHMRGVAYFFSVLPPVVMAVGGGLLLSRLGRVANRSVVVGTAVVSLGLVAVDFYPYRADFGKRVPEQTAADIAEVASHIKASDGWSRFMARETYSPLSEIIVKESGHPNAWGWLNWDSPKGTGELFLERIYPSLHRSETVGKALRLAGMAGVRFIVYSLLEGPPPPRTAHLRLVKETPTLALYENRLFRPFVQLYEPPDGGEEKGGLVALAAEAVERCEAERQGPARVAITLDLTKPALLMIAESWYKGWSVRVNEAECPLVKVLGAFQGVRLHAGRNEVVFQYEAPWYFAAGVALSLATAALLVLLAVPRIRRRWLRIWVHICCRLRQTRQGGHVSVSAGVGDAGARP